MVHYRYNGDALMRDGQQVGVSVSPALLGVVPEAVKSASGGISGIVVHAGGSPP